MAFYRLQLLATNSTVIARICCIHFTHLGVKARTGPYWTQFLWRMVSNETPPSAAFPNINLFNVLAIPLRL